MEDYNINKIEEEIRQYKLYKIQTTENKVIEYENVFSLIKENIIIKLTKNSISSIFWLVLLIISIALIIISFVFIFPEFSIGFLEQDGKIISPTDKNYILDFLPFFGFLVLGIGILSGVISSLLKKNNRKRNTIYNLSKLLEEVIGYMDENVKEEKKKYEYYIDSLSELKNRNNNMENENNAQQ